ncbi:hypothetical protein L3X38_032194 [Prunus dulcis]|uniref:Uncharacterized protein n=1 Tax=Prunus dulcis TaxID=3755 RepID=A0AAD4YUR5_PRUDU|nr:hypothetical protein L3X38_032194 [Prunus dulcis]
MKLSRSSDEVKVAADALNIKQQELESQRREVHPLLLAKGISADNADGVIEAATRSSPRASFVLFGILHSFKAYNSSSFLLFFNFYWATPSSITSLDTFLPRACINF